MFVRVKSTPNSPRKSVQIVESVRDGNKIKQRIVRYVGIAMNENELKRLKELAEFIKAEMKEEHAPTLFGPEKMSEMAIEAGKKRDSEDRIMVNLKELEEEQRSIIGIHEIYGKIYQEIGLNNVLPSYKSESLSRILKHIVLARIANPKSKRASVDMLEKDFGVQINLQQVYRMMDKLDDNALKQIDESVFNATRRVVGEKIDVIFVDSTTLYFESFTEDEFKKNGYSKDLKFNQPQVLLALMVTKHGLPIGYEAFSGDQYEGHTLIPLVEKISAKYEIDKLVFVADSGLLNRKNLQILEEKGYDYIVGARLRTTSKKLQDEILNLSYYKEIKNFDGDVIKMRELDYDENRRLIVTHSTKRARKDEHDREKTVVKLQEKFKKSDDPSKLVSNHGYKKFIKVVGKSKVVINEEKIKKEKMWDGLHGIITNSDLSPQEALRQYRGLWQVEESFRINKHDLKIRPIFHWTPSRIKAHLALSFMSFACVRHLEYRISLQYKKMSSDAIRNSLIRIQASILKDRDSNRYVVPSKPDQDAIKIYQLMGLRYSATPFRLS